MSEGGDLHENGDFLQVKRVLSGNERIPGLGDRDFIYTKNSGAARAIYLRNPTIKKAYTSNNFPLRGPLT